MKHLRDITTQLGQKEAVLRDSLYLNLAKAITWESVGGKTLVILDVGCGRGELMHLLSKQGHKAYGLDVEPDCVALAAPYGKTMVGGFNCLTEARDLLFPDVAINVVVSSHVLEHVDDPLKCLRQARTVGASRYVFAVPNVLRSIRLLRAIAGSTRADHPTHVYGWTQPEFNALLNRAGFEVIGWRSDRVTVNPFSGRFGTIITRVLSPLETRLLPKMFPMLSSSLIAVCRPV